MTPKGSDCKLTIGERKLEKLAGFPVENRVRTGFSPQRETDMSSAFVSSPKIYYVKADQFHFCCSCSANPRRAAIQTAQRRGFERAASTHIGLDRNELKLL